MTFRRQRAASLFIVLLLLGGCATSPAERADEQREGLAREVKDEREIGQLIAARLAGTFGSYDQDQRLLVYLNLLGNAIAEQGSRPELIYRFGILKSDEVNAFATPGGYVFVTAGLLRAVKSESELAGVLAHEIAHITRYHMYSEIAPKHEVSTGETVTRMLSRGGSDIGYSLGKAVNAGLDLLLETGLGAEKESEADAVGAVIAATSGYDPESLYLFLQRLSLLVPAHDTDGRWAKTHPPFPERLRRLREFIDKNGLKQGAQASRAHSDAARSKRFGAALAGMREIGEI